MIFPSDLQIYLHAKENKKQARLKRQVTRNKDK
jgi:hypothetical protein